MALTRPHASCRYPMLSNQECACGLPTGIYTLFIPFPMRQANTVMTILGFTSTRSSGRAYTLAPIFRAIEMAYLKGRKEEEWGESEQHSMKGTPQDHTHCHPTYDIPCTTHHILYLRYSAELILGILGVCHGILPFLWANLGPTKLLTLIRLAV